MNRTAYLDGARRAWPLAVAVGGFGVTYGVLAREAGLGAVATIVFSLITFAGSAQFAAVSILHDGGTAAAAIVAALLLNSRYVPIGLSLAPWLPGRALSRAAQGQVAVDESWAVSHQGGGRYDPRVLVGAGLLLYVAWVSASVLGALAGSLLGDPAALGLDAGFPALFLALLAGQVRDRAALGAAVAGGLVALAMVPLTPPGVPIVVAALVCLAGVRGSRSAVP